MTAADKCLYTLMPPWHSFYSSGERTSSSKVNVLHTQRSARRATYKASVLRHKTGNTGVAAFTEAHPHGKVNHTLHAVEDFRRLERAEKLQVLPLSHSHISEWTHVQYYIQLGEMTLQA